MISQRWIILGIAVVLILAGFFVFVRKQEESQQPQPTAPGPAVLTENQGECLPLYGMGKQTYDILTDKPSSLQIVQVEVDPIDVQQGQTQTVTVKVKDKDNNTITKESGVSANIFTDSKNFVAALKLIKAEDEQEKNQATSFITTWQGSWLKEDSTCNTYTQKITATNSKGEESSVDLSFK
jgi:hypothetical protein